MKFDNIPEELAEKLEEDADDYAIFQKSELSEEFEDYDSDVSDLSTVINSRIEELEQERDEAAQARDEAQDELAEAEEEREAAVEKRDEAMEALGRPYAERLSEVTGFSEESLMEKFTTEELQDEYEERAEELAEAEEEESDTESLLHSLNPIPKAQHDGSEAEELGEGEEGDTVVEDLSVTDKQDLKELAGQIENYESAGGPWADAADSARKQFEDLADAEYEEVEVADL